MFGGFNVKQVFI